jgi:hypothetical protein
MEREAGGSADALRDLQWHWEEAYLPDLHQRSRNMARTAEQLTPKSAARHASVQPRMCPRVAPAPH